MKFPILLHICKSLNSLGEIGYFLRIPTLNSVLDTVIYVTLKNNLSRLVQSGFCGVYLSQYILAGNVLIYHTINCVDLTDYFFQASVS